MPFSPITTFAAAVKAIVPKLVKERLKLLMPWWFPIYCPVCRSRHESMMPFGSPLRPNAQCPKCGALERHRLLWLFLARETDVFSSASLRLLHFAPEPDLSDRLKQLSGLHYVSVDLAPDRRPSVLTDIVRLAFTDASFDVIICSHVLEHIGDDKTAMRECFRLLRPDGFLIVMVPLQSVPTDEDLTVTDPRERKRRFGQIDHVRYYGPDIVDRLSEAGFSVTMFGPNRVLRDRDGNVGITPNEAPVILCTPGVGQSPIPLP